MTTLDGFLNLEAGYLSASTALLAAAALLFGWQLCLYIADMSRYPKGPLRLPGIGNVLHLIWHGDMLELLLQSWRRYGDVFTIKIGSKIFVVLNGYDTISDALIKKADSFSERNKFFNALKGPTDDKGIIFAPYPTWKIHRKLTLKVFTEMGYVKQDLESKVNQEVFKLIPALLATEQKPFFVEDILLKAVANVIANMVFGSRFEYDDTEFIALLNNIRKYFKIGRLVAMAELFPILSYLPVDLFKMKDIIAINDEFYRIYERRISEHESDTSPANFSLIDAYFAEMKKEKDSTTGFYTKLGCIGLVGDLFTAGSETTTTSLDWACQCCIVHPAIQQRIHKEIDHVVGEREASIADRQKMPYVNAFLTEVLRFGNVGALAAPHRVIHDVELNGIFIPKETEIIVNLHSILYDEKKFDEPSVFQPTRFLDKEGKFVQPEKLTPFGLGRRTCIGEELARTELFLFFTAILQRFTLLPAPGVKLSTKGILGLTRRPAPYQLIAVPRLMSSSNGKTTCDEAN